MLTPHTQQMSSHCSSSPSIMGNKIHEGLLTSELNHESANKER